MTASKLISARIRELGDWRGEKLALVRKLIHEADPAIVEEWKWGTPVWSHDGIVCTGESYKQVVKLTFPKGASLADPHRLFNSSMKGNARRAIDLRAEDKIDGAQFRELIQAAVDFNQRRSSKKPVLLSGGNPQIAKADGDAPVQAYIAAMPGWKREVGRRLDALIVRTVPDVRKAVKWNTPFYGLEGRGWFLGFHCITKYVKVAFFKGTSLRPKPPVESKVKGTRYFHIHEGDAIDEARVASWIKQASERPGWIP